MPTKRIITTPNDPRASEKDGGNKSKKSKTPPSVARTSSSLSSSSPMRISKNIPFSIAAALSNHRNRHRLGSRINSSGMFSAVPSPTKTNNGDVCRGNVLDHCDDMAAVDIVSVVLSTTIPASNMAPYSSKHKQKSRIRFLIGDHSLPRGQCARVSIPITGGAGFGMRQHSVSLGMASLLGIDGLGGINGVWGGRLGAKAGADAVVADADKSPGVLGMLQPGDIVRWNHFEVRDDYGERMDAVSIAPGGKKEPDHCPRQQSTGSSKTKQEHPFEINGITPKVNKQQEQRHGAQPRSNITCIDANDTQQKLLLNITCDLYPSWKDPPAGPSVGRLCRILPQSPPSADAIDQKETSSTKQQLHEPPREAFSLIWEPAIHPSMDTPRDVVMELASWYCLHERPHFSKHTSNSQKNKPCQRRKLRDIIAPNLLSHIVVKVLRCEKAILPSPLNVGLSNSIDVTHATVSDGPGGEDLLGFGCCLNHGKTNSFPSFLPPSISTVVLKSMKEGSHILLTNVLSKSVSPVSVGGGVSLEGRESLVLVPSRETTATIITPDHPYFVHTNSRQEDDNPFSSQPLTAERSSQLLTMTQQHSQAMTPDDPINQRRGLMAIVAPLMDIIIDGVNTSLVEGAHWRSPLALSKFLINRPVISTAMSSHNLSSSYRSATLILDPKIVSSDVVVNADGDALKLLCMDVPVDDMIIEDEVDQNAQNQRNPYLYHVGVLLRELCESKAPIRWVLEQEGECNWFVSNATLLQI